MRALKFLLFLIPVFGFSAAGDIKIDYKNSSNSAWITSIFAKQNSAILVTDSSGIPTVSSGYTIIPTGLALGATVTDGIQANNPLFGTPTASNYERIEFKWNANVATIQVAIGGTGANRDFFIGAPGSRGINISSSGTSLGGIRLRSFSTSTTAAVGFNFSDFASTTTAAGTVAGISSTILYNQVASAASNSDYISRRTETSLGSGEQWELDLGTTAGGQNFGVDNKGVVFSQGGFKRVTTQFDATSGTTPLDVTGLSVALRAGKSYKFRAVLFIAADVTGGEKFAMSVSSAPTAITYHISSIANATGLFSITSTQTTNAGSAGIAAATAYYTEIEGTVVANLAGNLTVQFSRNAASGTSSVQVGSYLEVEGF